MKTNDITPDANNPFGDSYTIYEKINRLDNAIITYPSMTAAYQGLVECVTMSETSKEPTGAVLVGVGGMGKTSICNMILKRFSTYVVEDEFSNTTARPAFYSSVPSPSTIKSLAANLLESLGDPFPKKGSAHVLTSRLNTLLKQCQTKIILLDEFHHLLLEGSVNEKRTHKICNWLKSLINNTGVMVCLVGTPSCEALVNFDSQMSRRFMHRYKLTPLHIGTSDEPGPLGGFLRALSKNYAKELSLEGLTDFNKPLHIQQMWAATGGNPAFISALFKKAIASALIAKRSKVDEEDFAMAFDSGITLPTAEFHENPFRMSSQKIAIALGEKTLKGRTAC